MFRTIFGGFTDLTRGKRVIIKPRCLDIHFDLGIQAGNRRLCGQGFVLPDCSRGVNNLALQVG